LERFFGKLKKSPGAPWGEIPPKILPPILGPHLFGGEGHQESLLKKMGAPKIKNPGKLAFIYPLYALSVTPWGRNKENNWENVAKTLC